MKDDADRWRFLKLLRYLNDDDVPRNWEREITPALIRDNFARPHGWRKAKPYVSILSYCLMDNHLHLLVRERMEAGIAMFMQRLCRSMAAHYNAKYDESGALFQGPYKARVVEDDEYLQYLAAYINVKNPFEKYPQGYAAALENFEVAFAWAAAYPFSSTSDFAGKRYSSILDQQQTQELFSEPAAFRKYAKDVVLGRIELGLEEVRELEID